jgi:hypothetical protein
MIRQRKRSQKHVDMRSGVGAHIEPPFFILDFLAMWASGKTTWPAFSFYQIRACPLNSLISGL